MKTGLTRKQKITEFYFNEHDDLAEIYTHNTDLKKRLLAYAKEYPELCQLTEDDEQGGRDRDRNDMQSSLVGHDRPPFILLYVPE